MNFLLRNIEHLDNITSVLSNSLFISSFLFEDKNVKIALIGASCIFICATLLKKNLF